MKRPRAFICFEVSGTVMKHEARVFDMSSQMKKITNYAVIFFLLYCIVSVTCDNQ